MNVLGLVLARGGSQRVANKNIRPLNRIPLLAYTLNAMKESKRITRMIVSTNDEAIAAVARSYGSETPFLRPEAISGPDSTEWEAFSHALTWLERTEKYQPELVVLLRPTTPFRKASTVDKAVDMLLAEPDADSVRSVRWCSEHPHKMWVGDGKYIRSLIPLKDKKPQGHTLSYHLLPPVYIQNASFDVIRVSHALQKKSTTGTEILPIEMDERESLDINTPLDFQFAEWMCQHLDVSASSGAA